MAKTSAFLLLASLALADTWRSPWTIEGRFRPADEKRWQVGAGNWKFENGTLVGQHDNPNGCAYITLKQGIAHPSRLEVEATMENQSGGGVQILFADQKFYLYTSGAGIWEPDYVMGGECLQPNAPTRLCLVRKGKHYTFFVDGRVAVEKDTGQELATGNTTITLWATYGAKIRYRNLRVR